VQFIAPLPFQEAIDKLDDKSLIGSQLSSSEWSDVPVELRDRAFFSSRVESVQQLQRMQNLIGDFLAGERISNGPNETLLSVGSRAAFVNQMQQYLAASGIDRTTGDLHDITSQPRLGIIFDTQVRSAQDFGHWKQGMDPDLLDAFPAQRFIRVQDVKEPRQSHEQYQDQVYLKTDPIWQLVINHDFGVPWGPWGWGCGHDVEDVDRPTAERLNLLRPGQRLQPSKFGFNHNLGASIKRLDPDLVDKLRGAFGNQITIQGDLIRWKSGTGVSPVIPVPAPAPAVVPVPVPAPIAPAGQATTLKDILAEVGLAGRAKATPEKMAALREALREANPISQAAVLQTVTGADASGPLSEASIRQVAQDFLNFFPPALLQSLPKLRIQIGSINGLGAYGNCIVKLNYAALGRDPDQIASTVFHEMMHWIHMEGPQAFRDLMQAHFQTRTAGEVLKYLPGYGNAVGLKDDWYDSYAGRVYRGMTNGNTGLEVPTKYIEWLAMDPDDMSDWWRKTKFRETMQLVLQSLF